jgi:hypothetical protein
MAIKVTRVEVWSAEAEDRAGGLAKVMAPFAAVKAPLECVIARRSPEKPGSAAVFVAPVKGTAVQAAARDAGFQEARTVPSLRIEGEDRPGLAEAIASAVGGAGVSMRGISLMVLGPRFVGYVGFQSAEDLMKAEPALKAIP